MTNEEKQKAINALKISVPVKAVTQEEFNDYIQTLNKIMNWLEQEPILDKIRAEIEECKQYRGMTGNPVIDKHNVGLDKYYDLGLEKAIKIIDKYRGDKECGK